MVVTLDGLDEEGRPILTRLGEDLQQVTVLVIVHQNVQLLQHVQRFDHRHFGRLQAFTERVVIRVRDVEELHAALFHVGDLLLCREIRLHINVQ